MVRAALYCRVSTDEQAREGLSLAAQEERLRAFCASQGWSAAEPPYVDDGWSGTNVERPALQRLLADVASKRVDLVVVYKLDRLSRRQADVLYLLDEAFPGAGVGFRSATENIDTTTSFGRAMVGILAVFAQLERDAIVERTVMGKNQAARQGGIMGGYTPYGYLYVKRNGDHRATFTPNPHRAPVVAEIFRLLVDEGYSCRKIARTLTERGIATPKGSDHWRASTVNRILRQTAYAGRFRYRRHEFVEPRRDTRPTAFRKHRKTAKRLRPEADWIEVRVPAIVTPEVFEAAQRQLVTNAHFAPRNNKSYDYLLKGLVRCGRCGAAMTGAAIHGHRYYACSAFDPYNVGERKVCRPRPRVDADRLEHDVWTAIRARFENLDLLRQEFDRRLTELTAEDASAKRRGQLRRELVRIKAQQDRWLEAYGDGEFPKDEVHRRLADLNRQQQEAQAALEAVDHQRLERDALQDIGVAFEEWCEHVCLGLDATEQDIAGRQAFLRDVLRAVIFDAEG